jgi:ASC-1-like (ASCH) protein
MTAYRVRTKPHRLTFRLEHLAPVEAGAKTCTVRLSARAAASIQSGDQLALCFGRYQSPTVLEAVAARVVHLDISEDLMIRYQAEAELFKEGEELDLDALEESLADFLAYTPAQLRSALEADGVSPALFDALEDSGADATGYDDVLDEASEREVATVHLIWWRLS